MPPRDVVRLVGLSVHDDKFTAAYKLKTVYVMCLNRQYIFIMSSNYFVFVIK